MTNFHNKMLETINSPSDIKNLSQSELKQLAAEIRQKIITTVGHNGGHLASNLGVVELTIALHRVFDSPNDAIIFDVSHQCYAHKLLTGRYREFETLRQKNGLSGFTNTDESDHDFFTSGHSSTSISAALGLLTSWNLEKKDGKVIAVLGDGALTGGMAFEGLSNAGQMRKNLIVILNDNQMSIDHNTGAVSRYLSRLTMSRGYQSFRYRVDKVVERMVEKMPSFGRSIDKFIFRFKRSLKGLLLANNLFTDLGFEYVGPLNGHNEKALENVLRKVRNLSRPVVVHVVTKKGKGYEPAETTPENFHGVGPFNVEDGTFETAAASDSMTFTQAFGNIMVDAASKDNKITAITAAMAQGTGLTEFSKKYRERFFDVGIAEEHAVTFAGGQAKGGLVPVVCIYSTFIQRAVDQMIHDITLQKAHCVFVLDRAGVVPGDGVTHQGLFDIALFRPVPGIKIMSPVSAADLKVCFDYALVTDGAVVIRIPKAVCPAELPEFSQKVHEGKGILLQSEGKAQRNKYLIVTTGSMYSEVSAAVKDSTVSKLKADIYILRFIKPFNEEYFIDLASQYKGVLFVEDGVVTGGIGEYLCGELARHKYLHTKLLAFEDKFYSHANRAQILEDAGMSPAKIARALKELANA
ncbi:MAG: 1-deoxy-D-xylulose-5-phosphate synthase [Treponema sp.]|nr:1-deoxy-D-xylulose-5-phosphate synthase [Treponema sp.]